MVMLLVILGTLLVMLLVMPLVMMLVILLVMLVCSHRGSTDDLTHPRRPHYALKSGFLKLCQRNNPGFSLTRTRPLMASALRPKIQVFESFSKE